MEKEKVFRIDAPPAGWMSNNWIEHDPTAAKFKRGAMVTVKSGRAYKILNIYTHCEYQDAKRQRLAVYRLSACPLSCVHYLAVQIKNGREYQAAKYLQEKNLKALD